MDALANTLTVLTEAQTAKLLKLSPRTLQTWRVRGGGPAFLKIGKRIMYDRDDLLAWMRSTRRTSTSDRGRSVA